MVRPAIGGREGMTPSPVPSGRAPRFGRCVKRRACPKDPGLLRPARASHIVRRFKRRAPEGRVRKNPSGARRSGGVQIGPMHPWRYKGAPPRAANVPTHCGYCPRAPSIGCWFRPFIRCLRSSLRADFSAQGTRLLRSRLRHVNCGLGRKISMPPKQQRRRARAWPGPSTPSRASAGLPSCLGQRCFRRSTIRRAFRRSACTRADRVPFLRRAP